MWPWSARRRTSGARPSWRTSCRRPPTWTLPHWTVGPRPTSWTTSGRARGTPSARSPATPWARRFATSSRRRSGPREEGTGAGEVDGARGLEEPVDAGGRDRPGEVVALGVVAAEAAQAFGLGGGLHPFGGDAQPERVGQVHQRRDDLLVDRVGGIRTQTLHKGTR